MTIDNGLNLDIHRALGSVLDAATHLNALQHANSFDPGNVPRNLDAAKQALEGALYHLLQYESASR
jgi:hypothetical protein